MIKCKFIAQYVLLYTLMTGAYVYAQETEAIPEPTEETKKLSKKHYATHITTDTAPHIAFCLSAGTGLIVGITACEMGLADLIGHKLGVTPPELKCVNGAILGTVIGAPILMGLIAGLYIVYKKRHHAPKNIS